MRELPAGTWPSPITAASMLGSSVEIGEVVPDGDDVWWAELRPVEAGRTALVRWRDGDILEVTPPGANVRTRVHEYGGAAWWVQDGVAFYVEFDDQRLRRIEPGGEPVVLTPEPSIPAGWRYADGRPTPDGAWFVCVRERHHPDRPPDNELVAVATDGSGEVAIVADGADFYASPRISPDGEQLVWVQWMHPDMPWDATELWIARLDGGRTSDARRLVGDGDEAVQQPEWHPDGSLHVVTDRRGWWNVYGVDADRGTLTPEVIADHDVVGPHWTFGDSRHAPGVHVATGALADRLVPGPELPYTSIASVRRVGDVVTFVGSSYSRESEVARLVGVGPDGRLEVVRPARPLGLDPGFLPEPELVRYPTSGDEEAYALYYAPAHPDVRLPDGERPPLLVFVHGGPTARAARRYVAHLGHRFWTSRGFAVVDVDYRGSTGYGRAYRRLLRERWCESDVDDAVAAAAHLARRGDVDGDRLLIRGGSAGGTTTLLALARHDTFAAGTNLFGVTDLVALMSDDHKFESRYTVQLVGPWPEAADRYAARSPINCADDISVPLLVLQGSEDHVVPPAHSERIVDALRAKGLPVGYLVFDGEGHGFRRADSRIRAVEAELWFYGYVLGFEPADRLEPVPMLAGDEPS
jgi:dipeptidyl aminopeptidase/acylaminoacyl peptidase